MPRGVGEGVLSCARGIMRQRQKGRHPVLFLLSLIYDRGRLPTRRQTRIDACESDGIFELDFIRRHECCQGADETVPEQMGHILRQERGRLRCMRLCRGEDGEIGSDDVRRLDIGSRHQLVLHQTSANIPYGSPPQLTILLFPTQPLSHPLFQRLHSPGSIPSPKLPLIAPLSSSIVRGT